MLWLKCSASSGISAVAKESRNATATGRLGSSTCMTSRGRPPSSDSASERFARAALGLGGVTFGGRTFDKELVALLGEALTPLGEEDSALRSRLLARLSDELLYSETPERAEAVYREAARIARRVRDRGALIRALTVDMPGTRDDPESDLEIADEVMARLTA